MRGQKISGQKISGQKISVNDSLLRKVEDENLNAMVFLDEFWRISFFLLDGLAMARFHSLSSVASIRTQVSSTIQYKKLMWMRNFV